MERCSRRLWARQDNGHRAVGLLKGTNSQLKRSYNMTHGVKHALRLKACSQWQHASELKYNSVHAMCIHGSGLEFRCGAEWGDARPLICIWTPDGSYQASCLTASYGASCLGQGPWAGWDLPVNDGATDLLASLSGCCCTPQSSITNTRHIMCRDL